MINIRAIFIAAVLFFIILPGKVPPGVMASDKKEVLASCLADKRFTMYGEKNCSACDIQKSYFADSFSFIPYVDCSQNLNLCREKRIAGYPTWIDKNGNAYKGAIPLETLANLSNCSLSSLSPADNGIFSYQPDQILAAFLAGLISFLAPCLLPLFPSYFAAITGFTFAELYGLNFEKIRPRVFISSLFFVAGFACVFVLLGATGSLAGQMLATYQTFFLQISGVILIGMGLIQTGILKIHALQSDYAWNIQKRLAHLGFITSFATGIAAALSWIPCIGPLLAPILLLSAKSTTVLQGAFLLFIYSIGLTIPFLLGGLFFPSIARYFQNHRKAFHFISLGSGIFLVAFGFVLIFNQYNFFIEKFASWIKVLRSFQESFSNRQKF